MDLNFLKIISKALTGLGILATAVGALVIDPKIHEAERKEDREILKKEILSEKNES